MKGRRDLTLQGLGIQSCWFVQDRQTLQISLIPSCGSVSVIPMKIAEQRIGRQEREDKSQFPSSSKDLETVISDAGWQTIRCP